VKPLQVGLLGIGTVGLGTWTVLRRNEEEITRRAGRPIRITWVADTAQQRAREVTRGSAVSLTADAGVVLEHPDIDIVVELIGGIEPARSFILQAIANGKHVVTANKALLARHGNEIFAAAHAKGVMVAFEGAVAGGVPIIKALREGLTANRIEWIAGIINGTSNFILSEMRAKGAEGCAVARLRGSRSDLRHRRHRRRAQAHDHVGDRLRRADAIRQGLHRRHFEAHA
jgi:homoserine dehydrogenase